MDTLWQDVRLGLRTLIKTPLFTLAVVVTLGLGIGANAAVFAIVNRLLLKPLPVHDASGLYVLAIQHEGNEDPHNLSWLDYQDYKDKSGAFEDLAAYDVDFVGLSADNRAERITVSYVSGNYFSMLGVPPALGRVLQPGEGREPGRDPVIVLGHAYWKKRFNADPAIVGRSVILNGKPFTVAGVVPEWFQGVYALVEFDGYLPLSMRALDDYTRLTTKRDEHSLHVIGRLKPGIGRTQAQAAVSVLAKQLETQYPETNKTVRARVIPERLARPEANSADQTPVVAGIFLVLVGLVLLVACVNVINLIMVRATTRQREIAMRAALGASRLRLIRQMLTESVILAALGGIAGALVGLVCASLIGAIQLPGDLPFRFDLRFDWRVFGYIAGIALTAGVGVGLLPALRASRADLNSVLREGGRGTSEGAGRQRARSVLVIAQVAVSLVLLVAAGLFVRSVRSAQSMDLGFDPLHVLNASMDVAQQGYDEARGRAFYEELLRRAKRLPGVQAASLAYSVPLGYYNTAAYLEIEGQPPSTKARKPFANFNAVTPEYLQTIKPRLLKGRFISAQDDRRGRPVAIVNQFMAQHYWANQDPIGKRFRSSDIENKWLEVVGVVQDSKQQGIFSDPAAYFYVPIDQQYKSLRVLQLRTAGDPLALVPLVTREIRALDADLPLFDVTTMDRMIQGPNGFFLVRMGAVFGGALGLLGLLLALVGVYGVVSYAASQRTQEIGVRMALGASRGEIMRLVLGRGLVLIAAGIGVGIACALSVSHLMANLLFNVSPFDPATFVGVSLLLGTMALAASYIPAFRATRIEPAIALRGD
ncbi:MAG TPA: ABC transporter permease [Vicinamibacterales bacterium]|nr:ABC transporter permease [Vicinamibacterales bacterium]